MKVLLAAIILVGFAVLAMSVGILLKRGFPKFDIGSNPEMAKRGIRCFKDEDTALHRRDTSDRPSACSGNYSEACNNCSLYNL